MCEHVLHTSWLADVTCVILDDASIVMHCGYRCADKVYHNAVHGYLFRTKTVDTDEGGLMSGTAALDSIFLV